MSRPLIPLRITGSWLRRHGACISRALQFDETFPHGVARLTAATIVKARKAGLEPSWLAEKIGLEHSNNGSTCMLCNNKYASRLAAALRAKQRRAK